MIAENLREVRENIARAAASAGRDPSEVTLIACFRRAVGLTPQQYICHKRLDYAKQLLLTTSLTQKQIAGSSGFTDPLYFSRVFSRSIGMSPSDYRRRFKL